MKTYTSLYKSKKNTPLVSILITAYNQEEIIERAIKSAAAQNYKNKEIVVSDDCSRDNTLNILKKLKRKYKNIKLFSNKHNLGALNNHRHLYHHLAKGKYAVMLDGDDYFCDNEFISRAVGLAEKNNLKIVFAEAKVSDLAGKTEKVNYPFAKSRLIDYLEIFKEGIIFMHGAVMTEVRSGKELKFYTNDVSAHDQEAFLKISIGKPVGFLKRKVYVYGKDNRPERHDLKDRIRNNNMIQSVYSFAVSKDPKNKGVYSFWKDKMFATFFLGHIINLSYHFELVFLVRYLSAFIKKFGYKKLFTTLKYLPSAYSWGYRTTRS